MYTGIRGAVYVSFFGHLGDSLRANAINIAMIYC
ncbi:unnamed protein product [Brassica oleracea var. botrytis]